VDNHRNHTLTTTTTVIWPFFWDNPGEPVVPRESFLDFMVQGRITRGRHIDSLGGRHSIQTKQQSTSINPPIFPPDALPVGTLPINPGLGQAEEYAGLHTPWLGWKPHSKTEGNVPKIDL